MESFATFLVLGKAQPPSKEFARNLMVYKAKDFTDILGRLYETRNELRAFGLRVGENRRERLELIQLLKRQPEGDQDATPQDTPRSNPAKSS